MMITYAEFPSLIETRKLLRGTSKNLARQHGWQNYAILIFATLCRHDEAHPLKIDLFADEHHRKKLDSLGDPLAEIESYIDFAALASEVDRVAPHPTSAQGGRPPYPSETMVRIPALKRLYSLSDEQMEYQLLDRMSHKRFCGQAKMISIPNRTAL